MIIYFSTKTEYRHCSSPIAWDRACDFRGSAPAKRAARGRSSIYLAHRGPFDVGIRSFCAEESRHRSDRTAARSGLVFVSASDCLGAMY